MKVFSFILCVCALGCSNSVQPLAPDGAKQPVLSALQRSLHLGRIPEGTKISAVFELRNSSNVLIRILDVTGSCSCTELSVDRETVRPRDTAQVSATIDTAHKSGSFSVHIAIRYMANGDDAGVVRTVRTNACGTVFLPNQLTVSPRVLQLGDIQSGQPINAAVSVSLDSEKEFVDFPFQCVTSAWDVNVVPDLNRDRNAWMLDIRGAAPDSVGAVADWLSLVATDKSLADERIPIHGYVVPEVVATPRSIAAVAGGSEAEKHVSVSFRHVDGLPIVPKQVLSPEFSDGVVRCEWESTHQDRELNLRLSIGPGTTRVQRGQIVVQFGTPHGDVLVPVDLVIISRSLETAEPVHL